MSKSKVNVLLVGCCRDCPLRKNRQKPYRENEMTYHCGHPYGSGFDVNYEYHDGFIEPLAHQVHDECPLRTNPLQLVKEAS